MKIIGLTGLTGAGKSTVAQRSERSLKLTNHGLVS